MELLALLSNRDDSIVPDVKSTLRKYTVYPLKTIEELEDLYSNLPLNLLLIDTSSHNLSVLADFLNKLDNDRVVLITPEGLDRHAKENFPRSVFDSVAAASVRAELSAIVERALEKQKMRNEIRLRRQSHEITSAVQMSVFQRSETPDAYSTRFEPVSGGRYIQEKVIVNFAKMLTASFDMQKLFDHFIDSVMEIARVSRMSVMLREKETFFIKTHYGLDPYLAENIQLKKDSALATWLARTGRIMSKPVNLFDEHSASIKREMEFLQCSVSFPMIHKGKLIGIFNVDSKITEEPFYKEELEIIYLLCSYLAAAVKDIDLYHHIWYQKEFTNNMLSSISSGMIAIDKNEKITIFNQQAAVILHVEPPSVIGRDLRVLASPLGDILYETLVTGNSYRRREVTLYPSNLPLGINSFRLVDEYQNPVGAGIVFTDLSNSKRLEEQLRMAEKLQAVNDLMAKVAHEVRNPLTSIQTYIQLLHGKNIEDELHNFYVSTVSQSISRLDRLIDRLITFSSTQEYNFSKEDINDLVRCAAENITKNLPQTHKIINKLIENAVYINVDRKQLIKAIYYLVQNIVDRTPDGTFIEIGIGMVPDMFSVEILISYEGDGAQQEESRKMIKPLLDINNLETDLNIPISNKIIEGHKGSLDVRKEKNNNTFIIRLPIFDRRGSTVSYRGGRFAEQ